MQSNRVSWVLEVAWDLELDVLGFRHPHFTLICVRKAFHSIDGTDREFHACDPARRLLLICMSQTTSIQPPRRTNVLPTLHPYRVGPPARQALPGQTERRSPRIIAAEYVQNSAKRLAHQPPRVFCRIDHAPD